MYRILNDAGLWLQNVIIMSTILINSFLEFTRMSDELLQKLRYYVKNNTVCEEVPHATFKVILKVIVIASLLAWTGCLAIRYYPAVYRDI